MSADPIRFSVDGVPSTAGSKRGFPYHGKDGRTHVAMVDDTGEKGKSWRTLIADAARAAFKGAPLDGPLFLAIDFRFIRPKGHFRVSKRDGTSLRADAPAFPTGKPDATKLLRAAEDALKGITWTDDDRVVDQRVRKIYGIRAGADVVILPLEPTIAASPGPADLDLFASAPAPGPEQPSLEEV